MAKALTGEFDIVAEFSISTVNRVLAAMHRAGRFLHSESFYVKDRRPVRPKDDFFSILRSADAFGEPIVDHTHIGTLVPVAGQQAATDPTFRELDTIVNPEQIGATLEPVVPSNLRGWVYVQLSPPTIDVADASGSNVTVKMQVRARYLPDPNTSPLREFIRGELQITAPVSQHGSPSGSVIDVDVKSANVKVNFSTAPSTPLSAEDQQKINLLVRNALITSSLPSTNYVPNNIDYVRFRALVGDPSHADAVAMMLNMAFLNPETGIYDPPQGVAGDPASMDNNFLGEGDDFAFAVSADFILGKIQFQPIANRSVPCYNLSFKLPTVEFQAGRIVLTVKGHAEGRHWWCPPAFDFTATQAFTLQLVSTTGGTLNTAELVTEGDVSVAPWYIGWLVDLFQKGDIRKQRNDNLRDMQPKVKDMMDVNKNLGGFLNSLLASEVVGPADVVGSFDGPIRSARHKYPLRFQLAYTSVEIRSSGIVLRGSLAAPPWPDAHVEFEQIPATIGHHHLPTGPNYSALKSWIPGGRIQRYEWSRGGAPPFRTDENTFVLIQELIETAGATVTYRTVSAFTPLCLTVRGTRLSAAGPVPEQSVSVTACEYSSFPVVSGVTLARNEELPLVALTQPGPGGLVQVTGYASARPDGDGGPSPNMIVHFADEQTAGHLDLLTQALLESRREDAPTAVLAVLTTNQLANARHTEGVIYTEEQGGVWERIFKVKLARRPLTLIVGPKGHALWHHEGELDSTTLAAALHRVLVKSEPIKPGMLRLSLRIGHPAPNFLFESAPGQQLTLRKLEGRPVELVFWKSSSTPSIETVRDRQERARKAGAQGPVVLAINDGEAPELAKGFAAENKLSATIVADPERNITRAYGVNIWPTTVFIDAFGLVRQIHYGRFAGEHLAYPSREKGAAAR